MGLIKVGNKNIPYDLAVAVPYDKTGEGEVTFYLKWVPIMKRTMTAPEEGGHWEPVHIKGFHYDDDLPDLEDEAFVRAHEIVEGQGLVSHDSNGIPYVVLGKTSYVYRGGE